MTKTISFSSSKFKLHNGGMSASELIKKKREKHINQNMSLNNNILMNSNGKIVGVKNYSTYIELTRPKHVGVYSKEVISGHNFYKVINKNGTIHERRECTSEDCTLGETKTSIDYLEKSVEEQTFIDISINEAIGVATNALSVY